MKAGITAGIAAAVAAGALMLTGSAVAAPGDTVLTGESDSGATVKLTVGEFGNATKFKIGKTKVECEEGGTLSNQPGTYTNFDTSDPGVFFDKRTSKSSSGEFNFKTKSKLQGALAEDNVSWNGTLRLVTKVFEGRRQIDTCTLKTAWAVA